MSEVEESLVQSLRQEAYEMGLDFELLDILENRKEGVTLVIRFKKDELQLTKYLDADLIHLARKHGFSYIAAELSPLKHEFRLLALTKGWKSSETENFSANF